MSQLPECSICSYPYTSQLRAIVKCPFCAFECCKQCSKQFILTKSQPQCISCHAIWNEEFLESVFTPSWVDGDLRTHLDTTLFEQEKSMLSAASQELYRRELIEKREHLQRQFNATNNIVDDTRYRLRIANQQMENTRARLLYLPERQRTMLERDIQIRERVQSDLQNQLRIQEQMLEDTLREIETFNQDNDEKLEINSVTIRCPKSNCKGFLTSKYYCPICHDRYCRECHLSLSRETRDHASVSSTSDNEHKCDPELVKTIKMIAKDTKPCPSCKMPIFKLEGCNMMFCTNCHTGFNWATGEIEKGQIHNPHYFEWLRRNGGNQATGNPQPNQEVGQGMCRIQTTEITQICNQKNIPEEIQKALFGGIRLLIHVEEVMIGPPLPNFATRHLELRILYLSSKGKLTEEKWKKQLSQQDREVRIRFKFRQLTETLRMVLLDLYRRFKVEQTYETFIQEIHALIDYYNEHSMKLSRRYGRRFYTGINKRSLQEYECPIVDQEAPFNYIEQLDKYLSIPSDPPSPIIVPEWLDEDERTYFNVYLYFYTLWYLPSPSHADRLTPNFIQRFCNHTETNVALHKYDDIISSRICSHPKKRVDVLHHIGSMIYQIMSRMARSLFTHGLPTAFPTTSIQVQTHEGIMTCAWPVPILTNLLFPVYVCGRRLDYIDIMIRQKSESNSLALRNVLGAEDPIRVDDTVQQHQGEDIYRYRSYRSISSIMCASLAANINEYKKVISSSQLWKSIYDHVRQLYNSISLSYCNRSNDFERFLPVFKDLYRELLHDSNYTRPKLIRREFEKIIRTLVSQRERQNQIIQQTKEELEPQVS